MDIAAPRPAAERKSRQRDDFSNGVWFSLSVGRKHSAEACWLLPMLCGAGGADNLHGGAGDDKLKGNRGADRLTGGKDNDKLTGNGGSDIFHSNTGDGVDVVKDFDATDDTEAIHLKKVIGITDYSDLMDASEGHIAQVGNHVLFTDGEGLEITLKNVDLSDLDANDFIF